MIYEGTRLRRGLLLVGTTLVYGAFLPFISPTHAQTSHELPIEEAYRLPIVQDYVSLSPNGEFFAYTLCDREKRRYRQGVEYTPTGAPDRAVGCAIWMANTQKFHTWRLTPEGSNNWAPAWSPDGNTLAFYSDRDGMARLWLWTPRDGKFRSPMLDVIHGGPPLWMRDGATLIVPLLPLNVRLGAETASATALHPPPPVPPGERVEPGASVRIFRWDWLPTKDAEATPNPLSKFDLAYMNASTGGVKRIVTLADAEYVPSPDGTRIVISEGLPTTGTVMGMQKLYLIEPDGSRTSLLPNVAGGVMLKWSPNGRYLLISAETTDQGTYSSHVFIARMEGEGAPAIMPVRKATFDTFWQPVWDSKSEYCYFVGVDAPEGWDKRKPAIEQVKASDASFRIFITEPYKAWNGFFQRHANDTALSFGDNSFIFPATNSRTKGWAIVAFNPESGKVTPLRTAAESYREPSGSLYDVSSDGRTLVVTVQSADHPRDFYSFTNSFGSPRKITEIFPALSGIRCRNKLVEWEAIDGTHLAGTLVLPGDYIPGKRYPTIVELYPDSDLSVEINNFCAADHGVDPENAIFASRGYAVLLAQTVIHPGGTIMRDIAGSIIPAVKKVVELGIADPDRLGITGQSAGGYATLAVIAQTNLFKAAVARSSPSDMSGMYGSMEDDLHGGLAIGAGIVTLGQMKLGGAPWQYPQRYIDNSPVFHLDKVMTPLLLLHGTDDERVPVNQSREIYVALRGLGREVELRQYDGEGHGIGANPADMLDYEHALLNWFDKYLKRR